MDERERAGAHGLVGDGMYERQDAVCSVAYTYCREPQAVPGLEPAVALSDLQV